MPQNPKYHTSPVQDKINRAEFIKVWYEGEMTLACIAKYFKISVFTVVTYAKRCKLEPRRKVKEEVIEGGLPTDEDTETSQA